MKEWTNEEKPPGHDRSTALEHVRANEAFDSHWTTYMREKEGERVEEEVGGEGRNDKRHQENDDVEDEREQPFLRERRPARSRRTAEIAETRREGYL